MAKRKNHTNRNQNKKDHRNGIKRPKQHKLIDTPGINEKRLKNVYFSRLELQDHPMPLVIESYYNPHTKITSLLFPTITFKYTDTPVNDPDGYYYTRKELAEPIQYFFTKVYSIEGSSKIMLVDKIARRIRYFDINTGKQILFSTFKESGIDKSDFLPQLDAQEGEIVIFPDIDEDDEL